MSQPIKYETKRYVLTRDRLTINKDIEVSSKNSNTIIADNWRSASQGVRNWQSRIRRVRDATSPLSGERTTLLVSPGSAAFEYYTHEPLYQNDWIDYYRYAGAAGDLGYLYPSISVDPTSSLDFAENTARERFYSDLRSQTTAFNGGVFVGEMSQTLRMIRSPAKALRSKVGALYKQILRKKNSNKYRKPKHQNDAIAGTWLEGSYGWSPLINDIKSGHEALHDLTKNIKYNKYAVFVKGIGLNNNSYRLTTNHTAGSLNYGLDWFVEKRNSVFYRGAIAIEQESPFMSEVRYWGFSPSDIVPTIWELVPYSFLIDYFTNIGKVIDASSNLRVKFRWGVRTERQETILSIENARNTSDVQDQYVVIDKHINSGTFVLSKSRFARAPVISVPIPDFRIKMPNSSLQWLNIGALVKVKLSSRRR